MKAELIQGNPKAKALWDYYQGKLADAGKWRDEYTAHLDVLIDAVVNWLEASEQLIATGNKHLLVSPKGNTYTNPLLNIKAHYAGVIKSYGAAFGLNPLADARLKVLPMEAMFPLLSMMAGVKDL